MLRHARPTGSGLLAGPAAGPCRASTSVPQRRKTWMAGHQGVHARLRRAMPGHDEPIGSSMDISLQNRSAIVTGGSKGIGFAIAKRFAESGADVAIVARGREGLDAAVAEIKTVTN